MINQYKYQSTTVQFKARLRQKRHKKIFIYQLVTVIMDLHTKKANIGSNPSPIKTIQLIHISQQQTNSPLKINKRNIIKVFQTWTFQ